MFFDSTQAYHLAQVNKAERIYVEQLKELVEDLRGRGPGDNEEVDCDMYQSDDDELEIGLLEK